MSATGFEVVCFAGPSLWGTGLDARVSRDLELRGPVRRGDIDALVAARRAGVIAIVDGLFHRTLAVGHAEIRRALENGWQVWGLSSIGAIRACEMEHLGMRGFGEVFRRFAVRPSNFHDDEVALLHTADHPYQPLSEPLVHIRVALGALVEDGAISAADRRALLLRLKRRWYGDRTLPWVGRAARACAPESATAIDAWLQRFDEFRVKTRDLVAFLEQRPWTAPAPEGQRLTRAVIRGSLRNSSNSGSVRT